MRLAWFGTAGIASALVAALVGSCLLDLDHAIACGDGHVDELAGEECDPAVPSSYVDRCAGTIRPGGEAACDPVTCAVVNDVEQCAVCGDGIIDPEFGEECDGTQVPEACPGDGEMKCSLDCKLDDSDCEACGNDLVDEDEECDPAIASEFVAVQLCADLEPVDKAYVSGQTSRCNEDCRYDRTPCGFCGNGTRDVGEYVDFGILKPAEWCDGDNYDKPLIIEQYGTCPDPTTRANVGCGEDCRSFVDRRTPEAPCCREKGEACPVVGDALRCCYEYDHPDEEPCQEFFEGMTIRLVCN